MKLSETLNRITPLPWRKLPTMATILVTRETLANEAYALHAANVLPELLAAAKNLRENWEHNLTEPMARLNEAIEIAQNVKNARVGSCKCDGTGLTVDRKELDTQA